MVRKKSETPQGDSTPQTDDGTRDGTPGVAGPDAAAAPELAPPSDPDSPPRSEPWDPGVLAPEPAAGATPEPPAEPPAEAPLNPRHEAPAEPPAESLAESLAGPDLTGEPDPSRIVAEPAGAAAPEPAGDPAPEPAFDTVAERAEAAHAPTVATVAEPAAEDAHDDEHEEEGGTSLATKALAVLVLLLAGAGLGIWAAPKIAPHLPAGMAPVARWLTPGQSETEAAIAALQERVDGGLGAVEGRIAALPAEADLDARIARAVGDSETKLAAEIEAARAAATPADLTAVDQKLAQLEAALATQTTELEDLKAQIAGTTGQLSADALGRIDSYRGQVEGLRNEMAGIRNAVGAFDARLGEVEARAGREVEAAQARVAEIQERADVEMSAAGVAAGIAQIRTAIAGGQPFDQPLADLADRGGATPPDGLAAAAESGVTTLAALRESYPDAAHAAIRASIMAGAGGGVVARSRAFLEAQVSSRSLTPQTGQGTDAVLSRMEDRLRNDDLDGVLSEAANLPSEAAAAMGDWLAAARKRAAAVDGLATLDASLSKTN